MIVIVCVSLLVAVATAQFDANDVKQECSKCTANTDTYYDGCRTCTCDANGEMVCPTIACRFAENTDPTSCTNRCDGYLAQQTAGSSVFCLCKDGERTDRCERFASPTNPTTACSTNPCADDEECFEDPKECFTTPCPQYVCKKKTTAGDGHCLSCKDEGVESFFDGCNSCSCADGSEGLAACTERACIALAPTPGSCERRCDGAVVFDEKRQTRCMCIGGAISDKCDAVDNDDSKTCKDEPCGANQVCVDEPKQCITTPCPQYRCEAVSDDSKTCKDEPCGADQVCVDEPKQCFTTPCPQYRCEQAGKCLSCEDEGVEGFFDGCNHCNCQENGLAACTKKYCIALAPEPNSCARRCDGQMAFNEERQALCVCINGAFSEKCEDAPEPKQKCGCDGKRCPSGQTCSEANVCEQIDTSPYIADGAPACLRIGGECCGERMTTCGDDQVCDSGRCVQREQCFAEPPVVPGAGDGHCLTCKDEGVKSFFDGCNSCSCADGSEGLAACTERACIALAPAPGSCERRCDGAVVFDEKRQTRCMCIGGAISDKCDDATVEPLDACDAEGHKACGERGLKCENEPKQCFTTPCPQYRCVEPAGGEDECGCFAEGDVKCPRGKACVNNRCQVPEWDVPDSEFIADGAPACVRGFGQCCGARNAFCAEDMVCHNNECIKPDECSAVVTGKPQPTAIAARACGCGEAPCPFGMTCGAENVCEQLRLGAPSVASGDEPTTSTNNNNNNNEGNGEDGLVREQPQQVGPDGFEQEQEEGFAGEEQGGGADDGDVDAGFAAVADPLPESGELPVAPTCVRLGEGCCGQGQPKLCGDEQSCHKGVCIALAECPDSSVIDESELSDSDDAIRRDIDDETDAAFAPVLAASLAAVALCATQF